MPTCRCCPQQWPNLTVPIKMVFAEGLTVELGFEPSQSGTKAILCSPLDSSLQQGREREGFESGDSGKGIGP